MHLLEEWRELKRKPVRRWLRFFVELYTDLAIINGSIFLALFLASNFSPVESWTRVVGLYCIPITLFTMFLMAWRGVYRVAARYVGLYDFLNIVFVGLLTSFAFFTLKTRSASNMDQSVWLSPMLYGFLVVSLMTGVRVAQRIVIWRRLRMASRKGQRVSRTIIVGAGDAGEMVVRELKRTWRQHHDPIGLVDDEPHKAFQTIHGVPVLGTVEDIPQLVENHNIDEILIAIPSAGGQQMRRIVDICNKTSARVHTLPEVASILTGNASLYARFREVDIEDLLRREPTACDPRVAAQLIRGESVLITGAGGSIGSELARQIARLNPANLILVGKGENSIFQIEQELKADGFSHPIPVIADVRDRQSMEMVFSTYRPTVVFHAAAHKHVPLMQANPIEAIKNNVFGTLNVADFATRFGVKKFINVSTDKAVNPSSVMGATKRVGEMIVSALAQRSETEFAIVRFGNVLGSRGSLIPILKQQIRRGGPVKITHPEMTRYFMTIPEAVQLIMHAAAIGKSGELFLLEMGEPVKIVDIAKELIRLHGLTPGEDIDIQYTGIRPGEKLYEELVYDAEKLQPTSHSKINMVSAYKHISYEWVMQQVTTLRVLCDQGADESARQMLMDLAWSKPIYPYAATEPIESTERQSQT